jgi:flavin-dependent dehydrogenase
MTAPITIVGGGVAGLSLAISLRKQDVPVVLFEKRRYPFHRVCGEFLVGVSDEVLDKLGIADYLKDAVEIDRMSWFIRDRMVLDEALPQSARGISRFRLDHRLAEGAEADGVELKMGTGYRGSDQEGLVWAGGKSVSSGSKWVGLSAHFEGFTADRLEMHCGPLGYFGISPIEDGKVNVTGLFRKDPTLKGKGVDLFYAYLAADACQQVLHRLQGAELVRDSFVAIAGFDFGHQKSTGFSIGDQALMIPPFAGNGMSMALEAAEFASRRLVDYRRGQLSWEGAIRQQAEFQKKTFGLRMQIATRLHPLIQSSWGMSTLGTLSALGILPTRKLFNALR